MRLVPIQGIGHPLMRQSSKDLHHISPTRLGPAYTHTEGVFTWIPRRDGLGTYDSSRCPLGIDG
jgi:hypothetical protein